MSVKIYSYNVPFQHITARCFRKYTTNYLLKNYVFFRNCFQQIHVRIPVIIQEILQIHKVRYNYKLIILIWIQYFKNAKISFKFAFV